MNDFTIALSVVGFVCIGISTAYALWRRHIDRRPVSGTGTDTRPAPGSVEGAERSNQQLADAEHRTAETIRGQRDDIERAADGNQRAQDLVSKARDILNTAQHVE